MLRPSILSSIPPSVSPSLYPSFSPSIRPSTLSPFLPPSFHPFLHLSILPSIPPSLYPSHLSLPLSIPPSLLPSIHPSVLLSLPPRCCGTPGKELPGQEGTLGSPPGARVTGACPVPGVAEQFAIAEAKLRAWSSVDGDDSNDESYDEDFMPSTESSQPNELPGVAPTGVLLRDLLQGHLCQLGGRHGSCEPESDSSHTLSPETLCSSLCSLEMVSPTELTAKLLGSLGGAGGEDLLLPKLPPPASQSALRGLARLRCQDPLYAVSYADPCPSPAEDEVVLSKDFPLRRKVSDVASSGVASLEEEEEEEEEEAEEP
uniref:Family with sequence similarity 131 member A n=1 Tax=Calidris pygmaea TaxID=425635 RepID=A0A8C3JPY8_9CHAR